MKWVTNITLFSKEKRTGKQIFDKLVKNKVENAFDYRFKYTLIENYGSAFDPKSNLVGYKISPYSIATPFYC